MRVFRGVITVFISLVVLYSSARGAEQPVERFKEACGHYVNGRIDKAIELYESLVSDGSVSTAVFYDLGNAYLKKGNVGKAVLNYQRAKIAAPRDSDINFNLEYARGLMKQRDIPYFSGRIEKFLTRVAENISFNENVIIVFTFFVLFLLMVL